MTHMQRQQQAIAHDDILDALAMGCQFMVEYLAKPDSYTIKQHKEDEADKYARFLEKNALVPALYNANTSVLMQDNY